MRLAPHLGDDAGTTARPEMRGLLAGLIADDGQRRLVGVARVRVGDLRLRFSGLRLVELDDAAEANLVASFCQIE